MIKLLQREQLGLLVLVGVWAVFFSRILSGRWVYFLDDLKIIYYPLEVVYAQAQSSWQLPVWSNLFGFGQPLLGWGQLGFLTPVHVVLRALGVPPLDLLQVSVMVYFALGLLGMYVFLRRQRLVPLAASLGALVYVFSGFNIGHLNHVNFYTATMVLPWLLVAVDWLLQRPTLRRAGVLALVAAAMALSAQPQIVLYSFVIAGIVGASLFVARIYHLRQKSQIPNPKSQANPNVKILIFKTLSLTLLAGVVSFGLASFAILPLQEFLPLTERNDALPEAELFEFSYPPSHAITLLLPYFFGDHESYWGAKGFQELAAFTGIIPLVLAALAALSWRPREVRNGRQHLRTAGMALVLLGIVLALGIYSPLYRWLVVSKTLTTLATPGRFVFFFTTGVALLAAVGLDDFVRAERFVRSRLVLAAGLVLAAILGPFAVAAWDSPRILARLAHVATSFDPSWLLVVLGVVSLAGVLVWRRPQATGWLLAGVASVTLLGYAWDYNPVSRRSELQTVSPLGDVLAAYGQQHGWPARLYAREELLVSTQRGDSFVTPEITPNFSAWQPVTVAAGQMPCFVVPLGLMPGGGGGLIMGLHEELTAAPLAQHIVTFRQALEQPDYQVCFATPPSTERRSLVVSFTASEPSGLALSFRRLPSDQVSGYLVRVPQPSREQLAASQKSVQLVVQEVLPDVDSEQILLARHLNVPAGASSARWIGALSIRPYRELLEFFLANDLEPRDGDGTHVLERHRNIFDLAGVTHLAGEVPPEAFDRMPEAGFLVRDEVRVGETVWRLYENPAAFPKAFLVPRAEFIAPADETRVAMLDPAFDPREVVYVTGPMPPDLGDQASNGSGTAEVLTYTDTEVVVRTLADQAMWLVVTDSTTPQWQTFIDGAPAPHYTAYTTFKAAQLPAGGHEVRFVYRSTAVERATRLTGLAGVAVLILLLLPLQLGRSHFGVPPQTS